MKKPSKQILLVISTALLGHLTGCAVLPQQRILAGTRPPAPAQSSNERLLVPTVAQPTAPAPVISEKFEYRGSHLYSVQKDGMYGYTEMKTGEVHFFRYDGKTGDTYKLIYFMGAYASMITCKADCKFADISSDWGVRTFQVEKGTILGNVIADMRAGALRPSTQN